MGDMDRATHRALVDAGYAPLPDYVERYADDAPEDDHRGCARGLLIGGLFSILFWGGIILALTGCAGPGDERLVHCQRAAPPWATGECR